MGLRIEDYAIIGNCETLAMVGRNGSIDWLGFPRFDSPALFAALLGEPEQGHWQIAARDADARISRRYRDGTLVLETRFDTPQGSAVLIDCMSRRDGAREVVRMVRGLSGRVDLCMRLVLRFEYGSVVPWVTRLDDGRWSAIAGPERVLLTTPVSLEAEGLSTVANFSVDAGEDLPFVLSWSRSHKPLPRPSVASAVIEHETERWAEWSARGRRHPVYEDAVRRSLITLKALTHHETGGIVAAGTTSLPEQIGGARNWDYRYCWLRDSTFTLSALLEAGYLDEAAAWREWLLRAVAGSPDQLRIMYGVAGERRLTEYEIPWLPGYAQSSPVRVGNAASDQLQLDVFGEVMDALHYCRIAGLPPLDSAWALQTALVEHLETIWSDADDGIWEMRGPRRNFVHSKIMAWVAMDRAVRDIEAFGLDGPLQRWKAVRDRIHAEVCERGYDARRNSFVQFYGSKGLDASLLIMALVGFLPPDDPRVRGTVEAIERELLVDGFVRRYRTEDQVDGLQGSEGAFLACSFWLADNLVLIGRRDDAQTLFEKLLALRNDVGLLAEEYDPAARRQLGNFPQAFSHIGIVNTAHNLGAASDDAAKPVENRSGHRAPAAGAAQRRMRTASAK